MTKFKLNDKVATRDITGADEIVYIASEMTFDRNYNKNGYFVSDTPVKESCITNKFRFITAIRKGIYS